jgi:GGDEF domain-containing protein
MNHIVNNLWLGSQRDADDLIRDNPETITAILNVRGPDAYRPPGRDQSAEHPGKAYKWIPAPDVERIYPKQVKEGVAWLQEQTDKGERILIHCKHGLSRSPAFLAAFMVESGISPSLEAAQATILAHYPALFATQVKEFVAPVVLVSALTGLPNRQAFDEGKAGSFVAIADVSCMRMFNGTYGPIAGDKLLRRLAGILTSAGLEAYHYGEDKFLCKAESQQELSVRMSQARQIFRGAFQAYAEGRIQTIEGTDFSFTIGATEAEAEAALSEVKKTAGARKEPPEWLRRIVATGGRGPDW